MLVICLLVLWQVDARGRPSGPTAAASPSPTANCARLYRIAFVTDVNGLAASAEADAWQGARQARLANPCIQLELVTSRQPSDYLPNLQRAADRHADLVIAASFLLTEAAVEAARTRLATHFVLVDPLVAPKSDDLQVLMVTRAEAGYLAGALAALMTRSNVIGGVYGLGGAEASYGYGFHRGARFSRPGVQVLDVLQGPLDGIPSRNPAWGAAQARALIGKGADVIFAAVGTTHQGALEAAAQAGTFCIGVETDEYLTELAARGCLLTSVVIRIDRMVELDITDLIRDGWQAGQERWFGVAQGVVTVAPFRGRGAAVTTEARRALDAAAKALANGALLSQY